MPKPQRPSTVDPEIALQTAQEISRRIGQLDEQRRAVVAAIIEAEKTVSGPPVVLSEGVKAAREEAKKILNGYGAALPEVLPTRDHLSELYIRRDALDLAIGALNDKSIAARASEAVQFIRDHEGEWRTIVRDALFHFHRFLEAEARARKFRRQLHSPVTLPMAEHIGGRSLMDERNWGSTDFLIHARKAAVDLGFLTPTEDRQLRDMINAGR